MLNSTSLMAGTIGLVVAVAALRLGRRALHARQVSLATLWRDQGIGASTNAVEGSVCFQGSGCMLMYQVGAARYIAATFKLERARIIGVSGGATVAACLAARLDLAFVIRRTHEICAACRTPPRGPFGVILQAVSAALFVALSERARSVVGGADAHVRQHCDGNLFLQLTHWPTLRGRTLSRFGTARGLVHAVISSMNLPVFMGPQYTIDSERYLDGSLSHSAPCVDHYTVRISPSDITAHVHPPASSGLLAGWWRFLVPGDREYMERVAKQGFDDAKRNHAVFVRGGWKELCVCE